jgi:NAD(P)-dependent dehydrogenase (short-subunit alcohol dehydrogenase family)
MHARSHTVLVTGGTSGLGRASVEKLARDGHRVFAFGRNVEQLQLLNKLAGVTAFEADMLDEASIVSAMGMVREALRGEPLDVVVNGAGVLRIGDPMLAMTNAAFELPFMTNVRAPFLVTKHAWPLMSLSAAPYVINVGSTTEHPKFAQCFHATYAMSKVALRTYSIGLRQEVTLLHREARVTHLKVGAHATNLAHDGRLASEVLAAHGPPFARYAASLLRHLDAAFAMVKYHPPEDFAAVVGRLVMAPPSSRPREASVNVTLLERLVEWLPQWILDYFVLSALRSVD